MSKLLNAYLPSMEEELEIIESIDETYEEIEISQKDVEIAENIEAGLEAMVEVLTASLECGGLSDNELRLSKIAVSAFASQVDVSPNAIISFEKIDEEKVDRLKATEVTLENFNETLKKIWLAIKAAVIRVWKSITDFFSKMFGGVVKLKENISKLKDKIYNLEENPKGEIEVLRSDVLQYEGSVEIKNIINGLDNTLKAGRILTQDYLREAITFVDGFVRGALNNEQFKSADSVEVLNKQGEIVSGHLDVFVKINKSIPLISGDRVVGIDILTGLAAKIEQVWVPASKKADVLVRGQKKDAGVIRDSARTIKKPTKLEAIKMLVVCEEILKQVEKEKNSIEELNKLSDNALKAYEKFAELSDKGMLGKYWEKNKVKNVLNIANTNLVTPVSRYCSYAYSTVGAVGDLVNKSIA